MLYSDVYHRFPDFPMGSFKESMVAVIAVCGVLPVMNLTAGAINPVKYRMIIGIMMVFGFLLSCMHANLICLGKFPVRELINVVLCLWVMAVYAIIAPWKAPMTVKEDSPAV